MNVFDLLIERLPQSGRSFRFAFKKAGQAVIAFHDASSFMEVT